MGDHSFETILDRMLSRVSDEVDKREGSIIYDALAPAAWEMAQMYIDMEIERNLLFADTATGEYLTRRAAEFGVSRKLSTAAKRKAVFFDDANIPLDVPIGSRYSGGSVNYIVTKRLGAGVFEIKAETNGDIGNEYYGQLLPIDYVSKLARAQISDIIAPGEDVEDDEVLRKRYFAAMNEQPFGGNLSDYRHKITSLAGVGGVKIFPVWKGGGTVKCTIISSSFESPSAELVKDVQTIIDPEVNQGKGMGFAPIGHTVTIKGAVSVSIHVSTTLTLEAGISVSQVKADVEKVIADYLRTLRTSWKEEDRTVVRVSQLEARILNVKGIADIADTKLNGKGANVELDTEELSVMGTVTLNG